MTDEKLLKLGNDIFSYCKKFNVPLDYLFEILEDQKVTPMIRGKAMEYNAYLLLEKILPKAVWSVQKLNLNAQSSLNDEDVSITHRRTGVILKVESKSAVRGSISNGQRARFHKTPHFKVKCHRSRSNIKLAGSSNDRYSIDSFDVLITNTTNAIFEGNTIGESLEIVRNLDLQQMLFHYYQAKNDSELIQASENDWRFCIPVDIAENGFIPRTPYVLLEKDPFWKPISEVENRLLQVVKNKKNAVYHSDRRN